MFYVFYSFLGSFTFRCNSVRLTCCIKGYLTWLDLTWLQAMAFRSVLRQSWHGLHQCSLPGPTCHVGNSIHQLSSELTEALSSCSAKMSGLPSLSTGVHVRITDKSKLAGNAAEQLQHTSPIQTTCLRPGHAWPRCALNARDTRTTLAYVISIITG